MAVGDTPEGDELDGKGSTTPPNLSRLLDRLTFVGVAGGGLFGLAFLYALDAAAAFFIPVILAHLLDRLFSPMVRLGRRMGVPAPLGAAIVIVVFLGILGGGLYSLAGPATEWVESASQKMKVAEYKLRGVTEPLKKVQEAAQEVDQATSSSDQQSVQVEQGRSVESMLMSQTWQCVSGLLIPFF
mgnify:CR=1 FL=1